MREKFGEKISARKGRRGSEFLRLDSLEFCGNIRVAKDGIKLYSWEVRLLGNLVMNPGEIDTVARIDDSHETQLEATNCSLITPPSE